MTPTSLVTAHTTADSNGSLDFQHSPTSTSNDIAFAEATDRSWGARLSQWFKQSTDFLVAAVLMMLALPLFLVTALLIKLTSPGPIFYVQKRVGKAGQPFRFFKFRTMRHDCDDRTHRDFARSFIEGTKANGSGNGNGNRNGNGKVYKMTADPRVTSVGRLLRRTSLDELPQIINVLRGEMSMVGPRPPVAYEVEHYQEWHKRRLSAKPGITGLWQVSGRSSVPFDEMVLLDLYYIENRSTAMDLRIMAKTLPVMVKGDGAY